MQTFILKFIFIFIGKIVIFETMAVQIKSLEYFLFNIGGYFDGRYEIEIQDDLFELKKFKHDEPNIQQQPSREISATLKEELISVLNEIYLPKWNKEYYNKEVCDGTSWELEIKYNQRKTSKISFGSNEYPKISKVKNQLILESSESYTKEFRKLLKILNKLANKKNFFY